MLQDIFLWRGDVCIQDEDIYVEKKGVTLF